MAVDDALVQARLKRVEDHVAFENEHDLEGVLSTFGEDPRYEDTPWDERHDGLEAVRSYYETLIGALPDLHIAVRDRYATGEVVALECIISGTHLGVWRGLPPTGRRVQFPLCAIYTFKQGDHLAGERIYYDRATVMQQLGVLHEPESLPGQVATALTHPLTFAKATIGQARGALAGRRRR